jgi:hypothetical protein
VGRSTRFVRSLSLALFASNCYQSS